MEKLMAEDHWERGLRQNRSRPIAMVDVAIDRHRGSNLVVALHVVAMPHLDHAKPSPWSGRHGEIPADADGDTIFVDCSAAVDHLLQ